MIIAIGIIFSISFNVYSMAAYSVFEEQSRAGEKVEARFAAAMMCVFMFSSITCAFCAGRFG